MFSFFLLILQFYSLILSQECLSNLEDEQDEEEQQDDLNADDKQLREEVSQHGLQRAHPWQRSRDAQKGTYFFFYHTVNLINV